MAEIMGAMSDTEAKLYSVLEEKDEEDKIYFPSNLRPRDISTLQNEHITMNLLVKYINSKPLTKFQCNFVSKNLNLWSGKNSWVITNQYNNNSLLILYSGIVFIDIVSDRSNFSPFFTKYYDLHREFYDEDLAIAKTTHMKSSVTHSLTKYYFVPYIENRSFKLHIPILSKYPSVTTMDFDKILNYVLHI